jgi:hypothetical protein
MTTISDRDQRILAALDADIATTRAERLLARIRARWSALALNLATVVLTMADFGLLAAGVELDSRAITLAAILLLVGGQAPTVIAFRYAA